MTSFSTKEIIHLAWRAFLDHWGVLWAAIGITFVVNTLFDVASKRTSNEPVPIELLLGVVSLVVGLVMQLGLYRISLDIVRGKSPHIEQLFSEGAKALRFFGASILYVGVVVGGLILFIIPGIMWAIKFSYYGYGIVDRDLDVMASMRFSAQITDGKKWQLGMLYLVLVLLVIVSVIPLGIGLIATIPMSVVYGAIVYTKLVEAHEHTDIPSKSVGNETDSLAAELPTVVPFVPLEK